MAIQSVTYTKAGANFASIDDAYNALVADSTGALADVLALAVVTNSSFSTTSITETRSWSDADWIQYRSMDIASAKASLEANGWSVTEIIS